MMSDICLRRLVLIAAGFPGLFWMHSAEAALQLQPLWEIQAGEDTSIFPSYGSPTGSNSFERGLAYNPVSKNVLVASRSGGPRIHVLKGNRTNNPLDEVNEVRVLDMGTSLDPQPVITTGSGLQFVVNQIGIADDGAVYVANLIVSSPAGAPENASFRIYRWASDAPDTVEDENKPYVAFKGNPDATGTVVRWGDTMTVRGSGANTQILLGSNTANVTSVALLTTENGSDFTSTIIPGALQGASNRGLTWGPPGENSFYSKSNGVTAPIRKTTFTLTPSPAVTTHVDATVTSQVSSGLIGPLFYHHPSKRMAILDLTLNAFTTGQPWPFTDKDFIRLHDINQTSGAVIVTPVAAPPKELTPETLTGTPGNGNAGNGNQAGAVAIGDGKVFVCSTNKGIQAFSIVDDSLPVVPTVTVAPTAAAVWTRGLLTLTGAITGTPPLTYEWYHNDQLLPAETNPSLLVNPVTTAAAGAYKLIVRNAAGFKESNIVNVTTPASTDTGTLTKLWQLKPGDRPWLTTTDTERGMDVNPVLGRVYVVSRATPGLSVQVLHASDGSAFGTLEVAGVTGGLAGITLNVLGVAEDGAIYACNLSDGVTPFKIYRWQDDGPLTPAEVVYEGLPIAGRMGDCIDVRGSGANTEIVVGGRSSNYVIFRFTDSILTAYPISVPAVPASTFNLGVAFGNGNEVWGKSIGTYGVAPDVFPNPLVRTSYNLDGTGTLLATTPAAQILTNSLGLAFDPVNRLLAISGSELSDSIRLYRVVDSGTGTLELLDQEFYPTDNVNLNGVGASTFAGGRLYTLNTNNGLVASAVNLPVTGVITNLSRQGNEFSFTLTGAPNASYLIQRSPDMASWTDDGTVVTGPAGTVNVTRTSSDLRHYFRTRAQ